MRSELETVLLDVRDGIIDSSIEWSLVAASDRPPTWTRFNLVMCQMIMVMAKCLLMMSAVFISLGILFSGRIFLGHCSCNHRQLTSI
jgi:hypothetical protein